MDRIRSGIDCVPAFVNFESSLLNLLSKAIATIQENYKLIPRDVWMQLLECTMTVDADFSNYDFNGAWPTMIDE